MSCFLISYSALFCFIRCLFFESVHFFYNHYTIVLLFFLIIIIHSILYSFFVSIYSIIPHIYSILLFYSIFIFLFHSIALFFITRSECSSYYDDIFPGRPLCFLPLFPVLIHPFFSPLSSSLHSSFLCILHFYPLFVSTFPPYLRIYHCLLPAIFSLFNSYFLFACLFFSSFFFPSLHFTCSFTLFLCQSFPKFYVYLTACSLPISLDLILTFFSPLFSSVLSTFLCILHFYPLFFVSTFPQNLRIYQRLSFKHKFVSARQ